MRDEIIEKKKFIIIIYYDRMYGRNVYVMWTFQQSSCRLNCRFYDTHKMFIIIFRKFISRVTYDVIILLFKYRTMENSSWENDISSDWLFLGRPSAIVSDHSVYDARCIIFYNIMLFIVNLRALLVQNYSLTYGKKKKQ